MEAAPGANVAVERRSIQMRQFKTKTNIQTCVRDQVIVPLGQIAGVIYDVIEKPGTLPNGEPKTSLLALGDFQSVCYETGEVMEAKAAYLPGYFAEALHAIMSKATNSSTVEIGIEIVAEPTGLDEKTGLPKSIPFAYGVKNLIARRAEDPLERLKRRMAKSGMLRLPTPAPAAQTEETLTLPGHVIEAGEYMDPDTGELVDLTLADASGNAEMTDADREAAAQNAALETRPTGGKRGQRAAA